MGYLGKLTTDCGERAKEGDFGQAPQRGGGKERRVETGGLMVGLVHWQGDTGREKWTGKIGKKLKAAS